MQVIIIIIIGVIFGLLISYAGLNKYNTIAGLSVLKDFTVAKTIMLVLGIGGMLLMLEMMMGIATFHIKPFYLIGTALGGIIFGIGMSILGYCPGTLPISLGQGSLDALWGIIGGILGGIFFTVLYPVIIPILGENLGQLSLYTIVGNKFSMLYIIIATLISAIMIIGAFLLHRLDINNGKGSKRWIITGAGLAVLNVFLFYQGGQNRPLGASSSYPYVGDSLCNFTNNDYYSTLINAGNWQVWFLLGAMLAGFIYAMSTNSFGYKTVHRRWAHYKGTSKSKRIFWALIGGFILIFGARMADGCTSGHIISGGMQFAISSYIFAIFTFIGFLSTGYLFYTKGRKKKR